MGNLEGGDPLVVGDLEEKVVKASEAVEGEKFLILSFETLDDGLGGEGRITLTYLVLGTWVSSAVVQRKRAWSKSSLEIRVRFRKILSIYIYRLNPIGV